ISDMLDSSLDANTMRMISSSHNYVLDRVGSQLTWRFDNILLPPTMEDPDGSKGYVHFKVKPFPGYAVGDEISNTAFIFFDFNPAIVTNTFTSTFVTQLAVNEFETSSLIIYPNPATDFVTIAVKDGADSLTKVVVYDISGKVILTRESALSSETIDLSAAAPGLYLVEISTVNGKTVKKLLID
ncbi:MAG TPA: T9SS type A sorting domain-containing protein, partial [Flavobacterium sp.]|nr:T9SS type A sorting domain-containing protein [Flavobacterium sp.]